MGSYSLLQGIFPTQVSHTAGGFFTSAATREGQKTWNTSRICMLSLRRDHANLLCIGPGLAHFGSTYTIREVPRHTLYEDAAQISRRIRVAGEVGWSTVVGGGSRWSLEESGTGGD